MTHQEHQVANLLYGIVKPMIAAFQVEGNKGKNMSKFHKAAICCSAYALVKQYPKVDGKRVIHCSIMRQYPYQEMISLKLR